MLIRAILKFITFALLLSSNLLAESPLGVVHEVKGNAFIKKGDSITSLNKGDFIYADSELLTEVGGSLSFSDYFDHRYQLSGSSQINYNKNTIELMRGAIWFSSLKSSYNNFVIYTANGKIDYSFAEGIASFDSYENKTQVLSLRGSSTIANVNNDFLTTQVQAGKFSFIQPEYDGGSPRPATPIGYDSYRKILSGFKGIDDKNVDKVFKTQKRNIASVGKVQTTSQKHPQHQKNNFTEEFYKNKLKELTPKKNITYKLKKKNNKSRKTYRPKSNVKVNVFTINKKTSSSSQPQMKKNKAMNKKMAKKKSNVRRIPASLKPVTKRGNTKLKMDAFEKSLSREYQKQQRHSKEVNSLIKDLKNFNQDYNISY